MMMMENAVDNTRNTAPTTDSGSNTRSHHAQIRIGIGIGGWTFEPWRDNFYPAGLAHSKELHYASRQLTAIEVNGTYYSTFKPPTFAKWHGETPEGFMFSLKANRFATHRRVLAEAGDSIQRFVESGITELKDKLGPIVWQFMPTKVFEPGDFEAFLALLPIPLATAASLAGIVMALAHGVWRGPLAWLPFALSALVCILGFFGLAYSLFPWVVMERIDLWQAAAAPESLRVILIGCAFSVPAIAAYTVFAYRVFGGKVRTLHYG